MASKHKSSKDAGSSPIRGSHEQLVLRLAQLLRERGETVAFAESCTGGRLSATVAEIAGVSDVYIGSIVAYANRIKEKFLKVSPSLLRTVGAVSRPVALQMAVGARVEMATTWAVSITGIAGPGGGTEQKPVGTVCFGLSGPGVDRAEQQCFSGSRQDVQNASVEYALMMLIGEINSP